MANKGDIIVDKEKCKGCGVCIEVCPQKILSFGKNVNGKGYVYVVKHEDNCTGCTNCAIVCPDGVISVYRKKKVV